MSGVLLVVVAGACLAVLGAPATRRRGGLPPRAPALVVVSALLVLGALPPLSAGGTAAAVAGSLVVVAGGALVLLQMRLLRRRLVTSAARSWLDVANGVPAGLALVWAFAVPPMAQGAGVSEQEAVLLLTPLGLVWLGATFTITAALLLRPPDRRMLLLAAATTLLVGAEVGTASAVAGQPWGDAVAVVLRSCTAALVCAAALLDDPHASTASEESGLDIVIAPVALTAQSIGLLAWYLVAPLPEAAAWAALATVVVTTVKTVVVYQQLDVLNALRAQAMTDALTGLGNRRALEHALEPVDDGLPVALVTLDLDRFKAVNDTLGHAAGDELLQVLAARLLEGSGAREVVVRLGGDEFALVLPGGDLATAQRRAARAVGALGHPVQLGGETVRVGASAGVAVAPVHAASAADLREVADTAMYAAKRRGGVVVVAEVPRPAAGGGAGPGGAAEDERRRAERRAADRRTP